MRHQWPKKLRDRTSIAYGYQKMQCFLHGGGNFGTSMITPDQAVKQGAE
jgi:hypothetical protein